MPSATSVSDVGAKGACGGFECSVRQKWSKSQLETERELREEVGQLQMEMQEVHQAHLEEGPSDPIYREGETSMLPCPIL